MSSAFTLFNLVLGFSAALAYKIPSVKLEILPQGFRVSIPDESGIRYVAFNINRNRNFKGFEPGEFSEQISEPHNNRWSYENTQRVLQEDDIIYVWTNVQYNDLIYRSIEEPILVERLISGDTGNRYETSDRTSTTENSKPDFSTEDSYNFDMRNGGGQTCEDSITQVSNRKVCKGQLLFEDNFEYELNFSRWQYEVRVALDVGDAEFVLYDDNVDNIKVADETLIIMPSLWNEDRPGTDVRQGTLDLGLRCTSRQNLLQECRRQPEGLAYDILPPVKSARISSREFFNFKFGRVEIRAKVPFGDWLFPLMLLEPSRNVYRPVAHALAQIRVAFVRGNDNLHDKKGVRIDGRTLYGGAVVYTESSTREQFFVNVRRNEHFADDFHIYTLTWTKNELRFQVDGQEYGSIDGSALGNATTYLDQFDQEFYLTLGVAAGGHVDFPDGSISQNRRKPWVNTSPRAAFDFWKDRNYWKTTWKAPEMQIDFVRVYAI